MNVDKNLSVKKVTNDNIKWYSPLDDNITVYGLNWFNEDKIYNRLAIKDHEEVKNVSERVLYLASNTSGGQLHFYTNSSKVILKVEVITPLDLAVMTPIGQAGFDCYVGESYDDLKFYNSGDFDITKRSYQVTLFEGQNTINKLVVINLPLYGGVKSIEIGLDSSSKIQKASFKNDKRVVIYGTSITQGGCATRPGMSYTNILSRRWQQEFLNFGFSGNAFGEKIFARIISEIENVEMYIINYEANAGTNGKLYLTLEEFIKTIRVKKPITPIIICSRIKYLFDDINKQMGENREKIRLFQEQMVDKFNRNGDHNIYYLDGRLLLGENYHEYTIDSIHPTDAGFLKIAEVMDLEIKKIIKK